MSQVYYTVTDDGKLYFTSSKNIWGASNIPVPGNRPKTKEECLLFLEYLRTKEDPVVPHRTVRVGLLNAQYVDSYIKKSERLKVIKESKSSEDAYASFARKFTETGCVDKNLRASIPASLWYKEDFYEYLISQGVGKSQLSFKGYGKQVPIGDNSTAEGRETNRRTELKVVE